MTGRALEIREAKADERERAERLVYDPPGPEAIGVAGSESRAVALGACLQRAGFYVRPGSDTLIALRVGEPIGVLIGNRGAGDRSAPAAGWSAFLREVIGAVPGRALPGLVWRAFLRSRLDFPVPPDAYHVAEVHVAPHERGRGIGTELLRSAESCARGRGCGRISLTTWMNNPARRLYERLGYRVVGARTVRGYTSITGAPGRVFMEKEL